MHLRELEGEAASGGLMGCAHGRGLLMVGALLLASTVLSSPVAAQCEIWQAVGSGLNSEVSALAVYHGELIVGGAFHNPGGANPSWIARWDGSAWQMLGGGLNESVEVLAVYNDQLIAGGFFSMADGQAVNGIAAWDGTQWRDLDGGMNNYVGSLTIHDGELVASGGFTFAGGVEARHVAR